MASRYPKLRDDIVLKRQVMGGEVTYLIKNRETQQYLRFREMEWAIISNLDGETSFEEMAEKFNARFPDTELDAGQVEDFVDSLKKQELIVRSPAERSIVILEKLQSERKKRAEQSQSKDVFYLTLGAVNPDKFYKAIYPYLRWIWTPQFVVATLIYFLAAAMVVVSNWASVREGMLRFWNFSQKTSGDILLLMCILSIVIAIHESAHALTCINFGGEVTELGFMLIFFAPAFYANVSDAYLFDKKWHKYWVTLAGGYSELVICSTAVFTWLLTEPGTFLNHLAYNMMVFAGISTIVLNYNPLIKLDGYYLLSDILEISNLRENAAAYISYLLRAKVFRLPVSPPAGLTPRKKRIFLIYGILSTLYIIFVVTLFILFVMRFFLTHFPEVGIFFGLYAAYMILRKRIEKFMAFSKFLYLDKRELLKTKASARGWALAVSALAMLLLFFPFRRVLNAPVILEPGRTLPVRAQVAGTVEYVAEPDAVQIAAGTVLIRLRSTQAVTQAAGLEAEVERLRRQVTRATASQDSAAITRAQRTLEAAENALAEARRRVRLLEIRAPFAGRILDKRPLDLQGRRVEEGEQLLTFAAVSTLRARVKVSEFSMRDLQDNQPVRVKLQSFPARTFSGSIAARGAASSDGYDAMSRSSELVRSFQLAGAKEGPTAFSHFELWAELSNPEGSLLPGMTGTMKIDLGRRSLAGRAWVALTDVSRSRVWW